MVPHIDEIFDVQGQDCDATSDKSSILVLDYLTDDHLSVSEESSEENYDVASYESYLEETALLQMDDSSSDEGALQAWKKLLKQHPGLFVSDPSPTSFKAETSCIEYFSLPILKQENHVIHHGTCRVPHLELDVSMTLWSKLDKKVLKWVFVVLNVLVELCQATVTQVAAQGKINRQIYLKLSIITSFVCLIMSIFDIYHEAKIGEVVWRRCCCCYWFYYANTQERLFGTFSLYFGLISSMIQLIVNLIKKVTRKDIIKFDYLPLLLALSYLATVIFAYREKASKTMVKCKIHGYNAVEGKLVNKIWVFECPECHTEDLLNA